jgi:hypothetical protein
MVKSKPSEISRYPEQLQLQLIHHWCLCSIIMLQLKPGQRLLLLLLLPGLYIKQG